MVGSRHTVTQPWLTVHPGGYQRLKTPRGIVISHACYTTTPALTDLHTYASGTIDLPATSEYPESWYQLATTIPSQGRVYQRASASQDTKGDCYQSRFLYQPNPPLQTYTPSPQGRSTCQQQVSIRRPDTSGDRTIIVCTGLPGITSVSRHQGGSLLDMFVSPTKPALTDLHTFSSWNRQTC